jgi:hypothetical protein
VDVRGKEGRFTLRVPPKGIHVKAAQTEGWVSTDFAEVLDYGTVALNNYRHTRWELHPMSKIEVLDGATRKRRGATGQPE